MTRKALARQENAPEPTNDLEELLDDCVAALYAAVLEPEGWKNALEKLALLGGVPPTTSADIDAAAETLMHWIVHDVPNDARELFLRTAAAREPRGKLSLSGRSLSGVKVTYNDAFDAAVRGRPILPVAANRGAARERQPSAISATPAMRLAGAMAWRALGQGNVPADRTPWVERALLHLDRALRIARRFAASEGAMALTGALLDAYEEPVAAVSADGTRWFSNRRFEKLMRRGSGFSMVGNRISLDDSRAQRRFIQALEMAAGEAGSASVGPSIDPRIEVPRANRPPLVLTVVPMVRDPQRKTWFDRHCALIKVADIAQGPSAEALRRAYGLTVAESRLCEALLEGGSQAEIASRLGISVNTVKTQLSSVFGKTGTRARASLIQALRVLPR